MKSRSQIIKNHKLITDIEGFTEGHLYFELDLDQKILFLVINVDVKLEEINSDVLMTVGTCDTVLPYEDSFAKNHVSKVCVTDKKFNNTYEYAYYHLGDKESHPEYFL